MDLTANTPPAGLTATAPPPGSTTAATGRVPATAAPPIITPRATAATAAPTADTAEPTAATAATPVPTAAGSPFRCQRGPGAAARWSLAAPGSSALRKEQTGRARRELVAEAKISGAAARPAGADRRLPDAARPSGCPSPVRRPGGVRLPCRLSDRVHRTAPAA